MARRTFTGRKLLVASIGAASVSYVACSSGNGSNTVFDAGPVTDAATQDEFIVGNLMGTPVDSGLDSMLNPEIGTVGNLMAPMPDTGTDAPADAPTDAPEGG